MTIHYSAATATWQQRHSAARPAPAVAERAMLPVIKVRWSAALQMRRWGFFSREHVSGNVDKSDCLAAARRPSNTEDRFPPPPPPPSDSQEGVSTGCSSGRNWAAASLHTSAVQRSPETTPRLITSGPGVSTVIAPASAYPKPIRPPLRHPEPAEEASSTFTRAHQNLPDPIRLGMRPTLCPIRPEAPKPTCPSCIKFEIWSFHNFKLRQFTIWLATIPSHSR